MNSTSSNERQAIISAYLEYFDAYTQRDWDKMVTMFAQEFTMFGTGVDEHSTSTTNTLSFYQREFTQSPNPIDYNITGIEVFRTSPTSAYLTVTMDMKIWAGQEVIDCKNNRSTVIMVKEDEHWKIAHGHWSQPAEGQDVGDSVPYKLLKERNKELEEKVVDRTREIEKQNDELRNLNETKTKLLSIIAHDLRSPFNAFMGLTEVMLLNFEEKLHKPDYFKLRLQQIHERAQHLYSVADNLLNWAWTQTDEINISLSSVDIQSIVNKQVLALEDIARSKEIRVELDIDKYSQVWTDPEILGIIIRNFLSNALKYSHRGSNITISILPNEQHTLITITDKGIGMDSEKVNSILNSSDLESQLGTEKEKGTGLGLQICRELVAKINGTLCIDSTPNIGTKVSISLPTNKS